MASMTSPSARPDQATTLQRLLDENSQLIKKIQDMQNQKRPQEEMTPHQELLHRNLCYIARVADPQLFNELAPLKQEAVAPPENHGFGMAPGMPPQQQQQQPPHGQPMGPPPQMGMPPQQQQPQYGGMPPHQQQYGYPPQHYFQQGMPRPPFPGQPPFDPSQQQQMQQMMPPQGQMGGQPGYMPPPQR